VPAEQDFEVGSHCIYSKQKGMIDVDIKPDSLMTPLLYAYNNSLDSNVQTYIGDMPMLTQRYRYANALTVQQTKAMFEEALTEWGDHANFNFNPMVKYSDVFIAPRVKYICEVMRQMASTSTTSVAVVESHLVPFVETEWRQLPLKLRSLESLLK